MVLAEIESRDRHELQHPTPEASLASNPDAVSAVVTPFKRPVCVTLPIVHGFPVSVPPTRPPYAFGSRPTRADQRSGAAEARIMAAPVIASISRQVARQQRGRARRAVEGERTVGSLVRCVLGADAPCSGREDVTVGGPGTQIAIAPIRLKRGGLTGPDAPIENTPPGSVAAPPAPLLLPTPEAVALAVTPVVVLTGTLAAQAGGESDGDRQGRGEVHGTANAGVASVTASAPAARQASIRRICGEMRGHAPHLWTSWLTPRVSRTGVSILRACRASVGAIVS